MSEPGRLIISARAQRRWQNCGRTAAWAGPSRIQQKRAGRNPPVFCSCLQLVTLEHL